MSGTLCLQCRAALRQSIRVQQRPIQQQRPASSIEIVRRGGPSTMNVLSEPELRNKVFKRILPNPDSRNREKDTNAKSTPTTNSKYKRRIPSSKQTDISALLSKPTWSVRSLLPERSTEDNESESTTFISSTQLSHLLRLSALPQPTSPEEESQMLKTLESQLHFVREIQSVDTTGVEPLQAIRDETAQGVAEITIGMEALKGAFDGEEVRGRNKRPRRRRDMPVRTRGVEDWDVLRSAEKKVGRYFVVDSSSSTK